MAALAHAQQPAIPVNAIEEGKGPLALTGNDRQKRLRGSKAIPRALPHRCLGLRRNGEMAFQGPEAEYRAFEYKPDFDSLPWKESYNADGDLEHPHAVPDL